MRERLHSGEVHVFTVDPERTADPELLRGYEALLSPEERERRARLRPPAARRRFLVARALVRSALSRYADVEPEAWRFAATPQGRPEIVAPRAPRLHFNLSHTAGLVACAVARERDLGVDVEDTGRETRDLALARRFFAADEIADLEACEEPRRRARFFEYWTLKEAYLKGRGLGLRIPLAQVGFRIGPDGRIAACFGPRVGDDGAGWQFALRQPTDRHRLALAVRRRAGADLSLRVQPLVPRRS